MNKRSVKGALGEIRTLFASGSLGGLTDAELVERFVGGAGDEREDAFSALARRHGPMVWGICRRMLRGSADAEDAFQAAFLVLARKAGTIRRAEALGPWLHGVAVRTAKEARRRSARRLAKEGGAMAEAGAEPAADGSRADLAALLHEEMDRLPGRFRDALVLCELEGASRRDAARRLGLPEGTLSSRLARGRLLLRDRLARRGVALGSGSLAATFADSAQAVPPESLALAATRRALGVAAGASSAWAKAFPLAALAGGVTIVAVVVALAGRRADSPAQVAAAAPAPRAEPPKPGPDDPLPPGATLRFGSSRYRHPTIIQGLAVSADGKVAVAHSGTLAHGLARVYDLADGRVRIAFDTLPSDVDALALSPDGKTLAIKRSLGGGSRVHLHDMADGAETGGFPVAASLVDTILASPDGKHVLIPSSEMKAPALIALANGEVVRTFPCAGSVFDAAFSPDGRILLAGGYDYEKHERFARRWEVESGRALEPLALGDEGAGCVAWSPDGATIAVGGNDRRNVTVRLFDADGRERLRIPFPGASRIRSLAFSPDGRTIAAAGGAVVRLFDAATGRSRVEIGRRAIGLRFAPDGATLAGAVGGTIYRWDAVTGRSLIPEGGESPVDQVAATPDGALVVTLGRDGDAHLWDARTGEHRRRIDVWEMHGLALSPDGRFLTWPVADEAIKFPSAVFQGATRTGCRIRMMDLGSGAVDERFGGFAGEAFDLFFIDGGKSLVTVDRYTRDGDVRVWDVAAGRLIRSFDATWKPESRVWRSRPSADGRTLAIQYQGEMRGLEVESAEKLWDLATGAEIAGPAPPWLAPEVLAFTPDGKSFAFATPDGKQIHLRDASTGQAQGELLRTPQRTTALAFGPDDRLYTGLADGTVLAWPVRRP